MDLELDGKRVHGGTGGADFDPGRPTAVFVHGAGLDHSIWALAARLFAQEGRGVLAVDLPGHGGSEGPPLESVDDMADWLLRLLDAVGAAKAALVGFSLGAAVALAATARAPERVRALALLGAAPEMPVHPRLLAFAEADDHRAIELMAAWCHGRTGHLGGQPAPGLWVMGAAVRLLERAAPGVLAADLRACHGFRDGRALAARVTCPALLIVGDRDLMTPAKGARVLADALPRAEMATFADCGHMVMSERPNPTLDALRRIV